MTRERENRGPGTGDRGLRDETRDGRATPEPPPDALTPPWGSNAHLSSELRSSLHRERRRACEEVRQDLQGASCRGLGVPSATLQDWYKARVSSKKPKKRRAGEVPAVIKQEETSSQRIARLERENAALRHQVSSLETDRAILKKAAAFFAKESE